MRPPIEIPLDPFPHSLLGTSQHFMKLRAIRAGVPLHPVRPNRSVAHLKRDLTVAGGCVVPDRASMGSLTECWDMLGVSSRQDDTRIDGSDGI